MTTEAQHARRWMTLKIVGVVFVGIHIPLAAASIVWLWAGYSDPQTLLLSVFAGTVAGLLLSALGILRISGPVPAPVQTS